MTDPSTRTLLSDPKTEGAFGTVPAGDFHVGVVLYQKASNPRILGALPSLQKGMWRAGDFAGWRWHGWTETPIARPAQAGVRQPQDAVAGGSFRRASSTRAESSFKLKGFTM